MRRSRRKTDRPDRNRLMPPEGVPLRLDVAGIGARFGAQIADILITTLGALAVVLFLALTGLVGWQLIGAIFSVLFFLSRAPYYVFAELIWNGQTLGKRFMKIRGIASDGGQVTQGADFF